MPGAPGIPFRQALMLDYEVPARYLDRPSPPPPEWLQSWKSLLPELATIVVALALLSAVLSRPRWMTVHPRRQKVFRLGFLAFTLGFIGWYAQGQLSVVQITGAINALASGRGLGSFLYDPVSLLLIAFTVLPLFHMGARDLLWLAVSVRCAAGIFRGVCTRHRPETAPPASARLGQPLG